MLCKIHTLNSVIIILFSYSVRTVIENQDYANAEEEGKVSKQNLRREQ